MRSFKGDEMLDINDLVGKIHPGDCLDIMKQMPDKCVDLVLTDPPYGIKISNGTIGRGSAFGKSELKKGKKNKSKRLWH